MGEAPAIAATARHQPSNAWGGLFWIPKHSFLDRILAGLVLLAAFGVVTRLWLLGTLAWFHVELFPISEYLWSGPRLFSFRAKLRALFDWNMFDVSPYRLRPLSDLVEILDAALRPGLKGLFGMHPSATILTVGLAAATAGVFYMAIERMGWGRFAAALFTLLLLTTVGFLSCFIPYIRPAKKLALFACCIVPLLCQLLQFSPNRSLFVALLSVLFLAFLSDETGYALLPVAIVLLTKSFVDRRAWREALAMGGLLVVFIVAARLVLPWVYGYLGSAGPRGEAVAGEVVFRLLGYLIDPTFYVIAADDLGSTALATFGIIDASGLAVAVFLAILAATTLVAGSLLWVDRERVRVYWNCVAFSGALVALSFSLTLFDWFDNPSASNYIGAFAFYYHSSVSVTAVFWLASVCGAAFTMVRGRVGNLLLSGVLMAGVGAMVIANIVNFQVVNRLFQILHTYPLIAEQLVATAGRDLPNLTIDHATRSARIEVNTNREALEAEYDALVRASIGRRADKFREAIGIYTKGPIGSSQFAERYVRLFYPLYSVKADVRAERSAPRQ